VTTAALTSRSARTLLVDMVICMKFVGVKEFVNDLFI